MNSPPFESVSVALIKSILVHLSPFRRNVRKEKKECLRFLPEAMLTYVLLSFEIHLIASIARMNGNLVQVNLTCQLEITKAYAPRSAPYKLEHFFVDLLYLRHDTVS